MSALTCGDAESFVLCKAVGEYNTPEAFAHAMRSNPRADIPARAVNARTQRADFSILPQYIRIVRC